MRSRIVGKGGQHTLPGLGGRVAARGAGVLLDVQRAATCWWEGFPSVALSFEETVSSPTPRWQDLQAPISTQASDNPAIAASPSSPHMPSVVFRTEVVCGKNRGLTATTAQSVRLVVALSEAGGSLRCLLRIRQYRDPLGCVARRLMRDRERSRTHCGGISGEQKVS